jgi:thiamine biosynthesis lipoprotein
MRITYGLGLTGSTIAALVLPAQAQDRTWRFHADHVLGTSLDLAVVAKKPLAAALAIDAARTEIARLDRILSAWRSDSELMRLNGADSMQVSDDLFAVILACESWRAATAGAYSARIGRLLENCRDSAALAARIGTAPLYLDAASRTITRPQDIVFAVDGLAKGTIIDRALAAARCVPGVDGVMVDIGGDLRCWGAAPEGTHWRIGVVDAANPADNAPSLSHLLVSNQAVATSGISARGQITLSPLTGARLDHVAYATVVADSAADADALATAFSVLPPKESLALADSLPHVAARIVTREGDTLTSSRWQCAGTPVAQVPRAIAQESAGWPAGFGLNIEYEVPRISAGTYHNPYVAMWITDENRTLIRTLLVLGQDKRYREENYIYWRRFGRNDLKLVDSVTRPTRAPGQYSIKWDGLDDAGKKVPQGAYTLTIEASREKGGHNVQRLELSLGADGAVMEAKGEGEIGRVRASYGRSQ